METGSLLGPGSNIQAEIGGPVMYMSEEHFKELYEKPSLFCVLFDTEKEQQQEMEYYFIRVHNPEKYGYSLSVNREIGSEYRHL